MEEGEGLRDVETVMLGNPPSTEWVYEGRSGQLRGRQDKDS
jgi:hypothetical protein